MAISLNSLRPALGAKHSKRRVGRGLGSRGTTAGRGGKGQTARAGSGGLQKLGMRQAMLATPKLRGFRSLAGKMQTVSVGQIGKLYIAGEVVTSKTLSKKGLIPDPKSSVKILADGEISVAVTVKHCEVSEAAAAKIQKAGGKIA